MNDSFFEDTEMRARASKVRDLVGRRYPGIIAVYLFRPDVGRQPARDVGVGILLAATPKEADPAEAEVRQAIRCELGCRADVRILNGAARTFARRILTDGRRILVRDAELCKALFERTAASKRPFRPATPTLRPRKTAVSA